MARSHGLLLVWRALNPAHTVAFAAVTGLVGPALLSTMCNLTTAFLGAANIALRVDVLMATPALQLTRAGE